jgi:REP element-mobilizing transposase RayT
MADVSSTKKPRGGRRTNAGRKKAIELRFDPSHAARPELSSNHAVHIMLRTLPSVPRLRQRAAYEVLRSVLVYFVEANDFRIVHVSIQRNHLHFIVEATDKHALRRGMQRFAIRAARAINGAFDRTGKVFAFRYHAKQIKTADYARNAIAYVLNNWRRHRRDVYGEMSMPFDRYSSLKILHIGRQRAVIQLEGEETVSGRVLGCRAWRSASFGTAGGARTSSRSLSCCIAA